MTREKRELIAKLKEQACGLEVDYGAPGFSVVQNMDTVRALARSIIRKRKIERKEEYQKALNKRKQHREDLRLQITELAEFNNLI